MQSVALNALQNRKQRSLKMLETITASMKLSELLFPAPVWHPHDVDFAAGNICFVEMDRDAFRRATFLDHRAVFPTDQAFAVGFDALHDMSE
jgi:hypothetical protein